MSDNQHTAPEEETGGTAHPPRSRKAADRTPSSSPSRGKKRASTLQA